MTDDLFTIPETPPPPLDAARKRLAKAIEAERECAEICEQQGPEGDLPLRIARDEVRMASTEVHFLEREEAARSIVK